MNGWLVYPVMLTGVAVLWAAVGLPFAALLAGRSKAFLTLAPVFGFCTLAVAGSWYSLLEIPMNRPLLLIVALGLGVLGAWIMWRQWRMDSRMVVTSTTEQTTEPRSGSAGRLVAVTAVPWLVGIMGMTIFVVPMVASTTLAGGFLTSFTSANPDLASYILQGTNLQQAGFGSTDFLLDPDFPLFGSLGDIARFDHTGASALLAATAAAFGFPVWQMATIVVLAVGACAIPAAFVFVFQVTRIRLRWCLIAAAVGTFTTYFWLAQAQGFLAQISLIVILPAQLAVFTWASRVGSRGLAVVTGGLLMTAGWFISPEVQLVALGLAGVAMLVGLLQGQPGLLQSSPGKFVRALLARTAVVVMALGLSLVIAIPRIKGAIDVVASTAVTQVSGYQVNLFGSGSVLLGLDGRAPEQKPLTQLVAQNGVDGLSWLVLMVVALVLVVLTIMRRDRRAGIAFIFLGVFAVVAIAGVILWGPTTYQTWKLIVTLSVPAITLLVGIAFKAARTPSARQLIAAVMLVVVGMSLANGQDGWKKNLATPEFMRQFMITPELVGLLESPFMQRQQGANMRLDGPFESMSAPTVYNRPSEISTPAYFIDERDLNGLGFPFACTVMAKSRPKPDQLANTTIVKETAHYVVLGTQECR